MPFQRRWNPATREYEPDRTLTGPAVPSPDRGRDQTNSGMIVGSNADIEVTPAKQIPVRMPGPRDRVVNPDGTMNRVWWRFLEELHRRTGALEDNVNWSGLTLGSSGTTVAIVITGAAPSAEITHSKTPSTVTLSVTGNAPTVA